MPSRRYEFMCKDRRHPLQEQFWAAPSKGTGGYVDCGYKRDYVLEPVIVVVAIVVVVAVIVDHGLALTAITDGDYKRECGNHVR